jgi:galactofuranosylgalactofuranosylrhamnosyl-N-acetylglucosaminyl-diphospho-decaprenol beta-1,5/1,6-galactofuranosyltransferase
MQSGLAATLIQAVDAFLRGPEILHDGSAAAAAEIRRIRAAYPETVLRPVSSVKGDFREMQVVRAPNEPGHEVLTWLKRVAFHLTDRAVHPTGMVTAGDAHWWHVSLFRRAVVTDMSEAGLRVRTRDRALAVKLARRGAATLRRLLTDGPKVAARYRAEMPTLTSRENWARLYGVDERTG